MQATEQILSALSQCLLQTVSEDQHTRKQAEAFLKGGQSTPGFPTVLMTLIGLPNSTASLRLTGAIYLKNFIKYEWEPDEEQPDIITPADREFIKQNIVLLMLQSDPAVRRQLCEAIAILAVYDFPAKWDTLLPDLVARLSITDLEVSSAVLYLLHQIFKHYRHDFKSDALWQEIHYVLTILQEPLLQYYQALSVQAKTALSANNLPGLKKCIVAMRQATRIFCSLIAQELPDFFADNLKLWLEQFHTFLLLDHPAIVSEIEDKPSILESLKCAIVEVLTVLIDKYESDFHEFLELFVSCIWDLMTKLDATTEHDKFAIRAINMLAAVARSNRHEIFKNPDLLLKVCSNVIIPNMMLRPADIENFEDSPQDYLRRDLEGSDASTRRKSAYDLVKNIADRYQAEQTQVFLPFVGAMLQEAAAGKWQAKENAITLVIALAVFRSSQSRGVIETNPAINVLDFYAQHILPELQSSPAHAPLLKASCMRFTSTFRNQLPREAFPSLCAALLPLLSAPSYVVHSYAAYNLDQFLTVRDGSVFRYGKSDVQSMAQPLLVALFGALQLPGSAENEYVMKAIMRLSATVQEGLAPVLTHFVTQLNAVLSLVCKNPNNPSFNHYLFDTIACLVRYICTADPSAWPTFQSLLLPPFQFVLATDVGEFIPYVLQIFALMLEVLPPGAAVPQPMLDFFAPLLSPVMWERSGNIPALTRLVVAFLRRAAPVVVSSGQLPAVLGVFQKLAASKINDHHGFEILRGLLDTCPMDKLAPFLPTVIQIILNRLQQTRTEKMVNLSLVFVAHFSGKHGPDGILQLLDGIQPGLAAKVLINVLLPNANKISGTDRRVVTIGLTRMLNAASIQPTRNENATFWLRVLQSIVEVFELPPEAVVEQVDAYLDNDESGNYQTAFSKLQFVGSNYVDPFPDVKEPKLVLVQTLTALSQQSPGVLSRLIEHHNGAVWGAVAGYAQLVGTQIV